MKFKSEIVTQASGSIGGVTYSHAKGGVMYRRARAIPVNPGTGFQSQVRNALTTLSNAWSTILTPAEREAWNLYGSNVPVTNSLGDPINLSGQNWYIACNTPRLQTDAKTGSTLGRVDTAPGIFNRGTLTMPVATLGVAAGISVAYTNTDDWANTTGGILLIFMGRPQSPSRSFFKGPYRLLNGAVGNSIVPPTSPSVTNATVTAANAFPLVEGQAVGMKYVALDADGRITSPLRQELTLVVA